MRPLRRAGHREGEPQGFRLAPSRASSFGARWVTPDSFISATEAGSKFPAIGSPVVAVLLIAGRGGWEGLMPKSPSRTYDVLAQLNTQHGDRAPVEA